MYVCVFVCDCVRVFTYMQLIKQYTHHYTKQ